MTEERRFKDRNGRRNESERDREDWKRPREGITKERRNEWRDKILEKQNDKNGWKRKGREKKKGEIKKEKKRKTEGTEEKGDKER